METLVHVTTTPSINEQLRSSNKENRCCQKPNKLQVIKLSRRILKFLAVINIAFYSVILYGFGYIGLFLSCLLFFPVIQFSFIHHIYQMNKKYLYDLKISKSDTLHLQQYTSASPSPTHSMIQKQHLYTPLLHNDLHAPSAVNLPQRNYCKKLTQVIVAYIKQKPIRFILEITLIIVLSLTAQIFAGGICFFKHGKLNIQGFTQQFYMLAGSQLRMSTEFTREQDWLPGNTAGDSLCSFNASFNDICHVYLNPDKLNFKDTMIITVHLMESGRHIDSESNIVISNVSIYYDTEVSNQTDLTLYKNEVKPSKIDY